MSALYVVLNKKLLDDIVNQFKLLYIAISASTSNCFDRVAYPLSDLVYQHFRLLLDFIVIFFIIMQNIEMYLLTLFGL